MHNDGPLAPQPHVDAQRGADACFFSHPLARWLLRRLLLLTWLTFLLSTLVITITWFKLDHDLTVGSLMPDLTDDVTFEMIGFMLHRNDQDNWYDVIDEYWLDDVYIISDGTASGEVTIGTVCQDYWESPNDLNHNQYRVHESGQPWMTIPEACEALEQRYLAYEKWDYFDNRLLYTGIWLNVVVVLPGTLLWVVIVMLFRRYTRRVPAAFMELAQTGHLKSGRLTLDAFLANMQADLDRWWSQASGVLALVALVIAGLATGVVQELGRDIVDQGFGWDEYGFQSWYLLAFVPVTVAFVVFGGMAVRHILVVTRYIRKLAQGDLTFELQPQHPDRCGGIKRLGDLCIQMAMMFLVPSVLITFWYQGGILDRVVLALTYVVVFGVVLLIVMAMVGFIWPIWAIHRAMSGCKIAYQDTVMTQLGAMDAELRDRLAQADPSPYTQQRIDVLRDRRDLLLTLYPTGQSYPTMPVDAAIWLRFVTPQVISLLFLVAGLEETNLLSQLFEALSGLGR